MKYKMNVFGCKEMLDNFMNHLNDLLDNKPFIKESVSIKQVNDNNILIAYEKDNDIDFFLPIITFDRDKLTTRTEDFVIDFGFENNTIINDISLGNRCASMTRDLMCQFLCGYKEFVDSGIVVSDAFEMEGFEDGCSLVIGSETDFVAKLDFISSEYLNLY
ncbi:MAG: hypothetical protein NC548_15775 [Lachnospiraceae bacterium]|nr:hypothetical protein [Lachnospiraceae bacterium]